MNNDENETKITPQDEFAKEYNALCAKYHLCLQAQPSFLPRDDNTFSVVARLIVVPYEVQK